MKLLGNVLIIAFFVSSLVIARTDKDIKKVDNREKNQYYWMKGNAEADKNQLERKRSHKRRRKMKKPVKGLR